MPWLRWSEAKVWRNVWKPGPGSVDLLCERLEDAAAEVVGIERATSFAGEGEGGRVLIGLSGEVGSQLRRKRLR